MTGFESDFGWDPSQSRAESRHAYGFHLTHNFDDHGCVSGSFHGGFNLFEPSTYGDVVPGPIKDGISAVGKFLQGGPVGDFVNSWAGRIVLTALSSGAYAGLAVYQLPNGVKVGAQVASAAFAIPGMAKGDDFVTAYMQELGSRISQTAQNAQAQAAVTGGASGAVSGAIDQAGQNATIALSTDMAKAAEYLKTADAFSMTAEDLASRLGIRVDAAQFALDMARHIIPDSSENQGTIWDPGSHFDPVTGRRIIIVPPGQSVHVVTSIPTIAQAHAAVVRRNMTSISPSARIATSAIANLPDLHQAATSLSQQTSKADVFKMAATTVIPGVTHPSPTAALPPSAKSRPAWTVGGAALGAVAALAVGVEAPIIAGIALAGALGGYLSSAPPTSIPAAHPTTPGK